MQVDINESKSRAFNIFLRFLQLSISTLIAITIANLQQIGCDMSLHKHVLIVSIIMIIINIIGIIFYRLKEQFSKIPFYIFFSINMITTGIILIVSFVGFGGQNVCANNKVFFKFAVIEAILISIMAILILLISFYWIQRYSNSPGNLVWVFLFLASWGENFSSKMTAIGVISLVISILTIITNIIVGIKGITMGIKKGVMFSWGLCLLLMIVNEIIAIVTIFSSSETSSFDDVVAKKLIQTFLAINIFELILWVIGLMTLKYENGDPIRDGLLAFGNNDNLIEQQSASKNNNTKGFGTIK